MKTRPRWLTAPARTLLAATSILVQGCAAKPDANPDPDHCVVRARFEPEVARAGEAVRLVLQATTSGGHHAYGSLEQNNVPVALDRDAVDFGGLAPLGEARVPEGEPCEDSGIVMFPLPDEFEVVQELTVPATHVAGEVTVRGSLRYQLCNEQSCDAPKVAAFAATLRVEPMAFRPAVSDPPSGHTIVSDDPTRAIEIARVEGRLLLYNFSGFQCATCRGMESFVFGDPEVAALMRTHFVESRLHVDAQNALSAERFADNRRLRDGLAGTMATPCIVVVDPRDGKTIAKHELRGGPASWTGQWTEFLNDTVRDAGR